MLNYEVSFGRKCFTIFNSVFLTVTAFLCVFPMWNLLAVSFSTSSAVEAGIVKFWPVGFTLKPYSFILSDYRFMHALGISFQRVLLGISVNMLLTVVSAYPLSKAKKDFRQRSVYVWYFLITMLFSGGLIPTYIVIHNLGLVDNLFALILPGAVPIFNVILAMNFFKEIPDEIAESAYIDGAGHWRVLWRMYLPLSKPVLATLTLFVAVAHWNSWFDGLIYMNRPENYPLQSYLQTIVIQKDPKLLTMVKPEELLEVSERNSKAARIFLAMVPILMVYPFLQKYFTKGIVLGSVKG